MKKLFTLCMIIALTISVFAQSPQKMSYQAVVRNSSGILQANQAVGMKISILRNSATGTAVYVETQTATANANGLVTIEIGSGNIVSGSLSGIDWSDGIYFIKTETDPTGGTNYTITGTSQILSVPYALYAKTAKTADYNDLTNKPLLFDGTWTSMTGKPSFATVATSGSYNDLLNKPTLFDGTWTNITGKPTTLTGYGITDGMSTSHATYGITSTMITNWNTAFGWGNHSGLYKLNSYVPAWVEITGKPTFAAVATSGTFADLLSKPTTLSGYGITNAMSTSHAANSITSTMMTNWNTAFGWGNHAGLYRTITYVPSWSEITSKPTTVSGFGITDAVKTTGTQEIIGITTLKGTTPDVEQALFEVKNKDGQTIFAVYNEGVRIWVADGAKGTKGGFAVGGFDMTTPDIGEYLRVTRDSTRVYVKDSPGKGSNGGFAVGGFDATNGTPAVLFTSLTPENYFIGHRSGINTTTGIHNSFVGYESGFKNTSGRKNVFLGYHAGLSNDTASYNVFIGNETGNSNTEGRYNTFIGYQSGYTNSLGTYNVFLGYKAGYASTTSYNTFIGYQAGTANNSGQYNAFMGYNAGMTNTTGGSNVFIGNQAGYLNSTGGSNVFLGNTAGYNNTASNNVFLGFESGYANTSGTKDAFMGYKAGRSNTTGSSNVFVGNLSGYTNSTGTSNVAIGDQAGYTNSTGNYNVLLGYKAGYTSTTSYNTFLGYQAGYANVSGVNNVAIGFLTGYGSSGSNCVFLGDSAGYSNYGNYNVFLGTGVGKENNSGFNNSFMGYEAGMHNTGGNYNVFIGYKSGYSNLTGISNVFLGNKAGLYNTSGHYNVYIGVSAGSNNTTGFNNVAIGQLAGADNKTGRSNVSIGYHAGFSSDASFNTFIGESAGMETQTGERNTFIGFEAGQGNETGNRTVCIGTFAGLGNMAGNNNVYIGYSAGQYSFSTSNNTFLGYQAGITNSSGQNNVFLGSNAGYFETGSNKLFIDNQQRASESDARTKALIYGIFDASTENQILTINGKVGIGITSPTAKLEVNLQNTSGWSGNLKALRIYSPDIGYYLDLNTSIVTPGPVAFHLSPNGNTGLVITTPGYVGVGRSPTNNRLEVEGNASKTTAGSWLANSDARIKMQIHDIENAQETLIKLHPVKFMYTEEWKKKNPSIQDKFYFNFIAQEFREVFPESVQGSGEYLEGQSEELLQLDSYNAEIIAIKALQEVILENKEQQHQIESYKSENENLKSQLQTLQEKVDKIEILLAKALDE